jgi:hypothetical protein
MKVMICRSAGVIIWLPSMTTGQLRLGNLGQGAVGRATFLPGWRWSEHVKPIAKTESCQARPHGVFRFRPNEGRYERGRLLAGSRIQLSRIRGLGDAA